MDDPISEDESAFTEELDELFPQDVTMGKIGLADSSTARGKLAMDEEAAEAIAKRIMLHLYRGSVEQARESLERGWETHIGERRPLPRGRELLDVPLARILTGRTNDADRNGMRVLNMLEEAGILTAGDLLRSRQEDLLQIPSFGEVALAQVLRLGRLLAARATGILPAKTRSAKS